MQKLLVFDNYGVESTREFFANRHCESQQILVFHNWDKHELRPQVAIRDLVYEGITHSTYHDKAHYINHRHSVGQVSEDLDTVYMDTVSLTFPTLA